jgi:hypothetical protein
MNQDVNVVWNVAEQGIQPGSLKTVSEREDV